MFKIDMYLASLLLKRGLCDGRKLGSDKSDKIPQPAKVVQHPIVLYFNAVYYPAEQYISPVRALFCLRGLNMAWVPRVRQTGRQGQGATTAIAPCH